jgi:hypothetical protein
MFDGIRPVVYDLAEFFHLTQGVLSHMPSQGGVRVNAVPPGAGH